LDFSLIGFYVLDFDETNTKFQRLLRRTQFVYFEH
jgi:hypothetical protein